MMKPLFYSLLSLVLMANCQNKPNEVRFEISGEDLGTLTVARLTAKETIYLDTLEAENDQLSFTLPQDSLGLFMISGENYQVPIFAEPGERIKLEILKERNRSGEHSFRASGNVDTERIQAINELVAGASDYLDSLSQSLRVPSQSDDYSLRQEQMQSRFEEEVERTRSRLLQMIDEEPGRLSNLFIWPQSLGQFQLVSPTEYLEYYEKVDQALMERYPNNDFAQNFNSQLPKIKAQIEADQQRQERMKDFAAGQPAPEISLPDPEGNIRNLSDLKGQVVLIDFWAAWCRPCRMANPTLVKIYEEYKDRGFTIFSVSLDGLARQTTPKESWLKAIDDDNLSWEHHVSDLKGWQSAAAQTYFIQSIPYAVLIDREGKIVDTQVPLSVLRERLEKIL